MVKFTKWIGVGSALMCLSEAAAPSMGMIEPQTPSVVSSTSTTSPSVGPTSTHGKTHPKKPHGQAKENMILRMGKHEMALAREINAIALKAAVKSGDLVPSNYTAAEIEQWMHNHYDTPVTASEAKELEMVSHGLTLPADLLISNDGGLVKAICPAKSDSLGRLSVKALQHCRFARKHPSFKTDPHSHHPANSTVALREGHHYRNSTVAGHHRNATIADSYHHHNQKPNHHHHGASLFDIVKWMDDKVVKGFETTVKHINMRELDLEIALSHLLHATKAYQRHVVGHDFDFKDLAKDYAMNFPNGIHHDILGSRIVGPGKYGPGKHSLDSHHSHRVVDEE